MMYIVNKYLCVLCFLACGFIARAQDTIVTKSGGVIPSLVLEVGLDNVLYKKHDNINGPIYTLPVNRIAVIKYENGTEDVMETCEDATAGKLSPLTTKYNAFWGTLSVLDSDGRVLSGGEVRDRFSLHPDVLSKFRQGKRMSVWGNVVGGISAGVLGFGIGTLIGDSILEDEGYESDPGTKASAYITMGTGLVGILVGSILGHRGVQNRIRAVELYNNYSTAKETSYHLSFGLTSSGVGVTLRF